MCTLALFWRVLSDAPVLVAANRDEDPRRPFTDPRHWNGVFAGRDEIAGGTWLGVSDAGLVCGITNRWGPANDPTRRSRGLLVYDALRAPSAVQAVRALVAAPPTTYNAFGLLVADAEAAFRVDCDGSVVAVSPLTPGITVLANWSSQERHPRSERAQELARAVPTTSVDAAWPSLQALLSDHDGAEVLGRAICAHGERYATVCATRLAVRGDGTVRWSDARGNPCTAPWTDRRID
jgi:uncharacterized protein with NRDE domain